MASNNECTCPRKTHLHLASCPTLSVKKAPSLETLAGLVSNTPEGIFFYVTPDKDSSSLRSAAFMGYFPDNAWLYQIAHEGVSTVTFLNGAEVTFLPEDEALELLNVGASTRVFLETTNATKDLAEVIAPQTGGISLVDNKTLEML